MLIERITLYTINSDFLIYSQPDSVLMSQNLTSRLCDLHGDNSLILVFRKMWNVECGINLLHIFPDNKK